MLGFPKVIYKLNKNVHSYRLFLTQITPNIGDSKYREV